MTFARVTVRTGAVFFIIIGDGRFIGFGYLAGAGAAARLTCCFAPARARAVTRRGNFAVVATRLTGSLAW
jgi:hypothetical protein